MFYYQHHIGDFDKATRHLNRIERSIYRDLLDFYYETENQLPIDVQHICRRVLAHTPDERTAVEQVLNEFFHKTPDGWYHKRCEAEIDKFRASISQKSSAGKRSAEIRALKLQHALNGRSTDVQREVNGTPTNQEPITINQKPLKESPRKFSDDDLSIAKLIFSKVQEIDQHAKQPNFDKWADDIRLMRERDNRNPDEIRQVFAFANQSSFWKTNILSPSKLREKFTTLLAQSKNKPAIQQPIAGQDYI